MVDEENIIDCRKAKRRVRIRKARLKQISRLRLMAEFEGYNRGVTMSRGDKMSTIDGVRAGLPKKVRKAPSFRWGMNSTGKRSFPVLLIFACDNIQNMKTQIKHL